MPNIFVVVRKYDELSENLLVTLDDKNAHEYAKASAAGSVSEFVVQRWENGELISESEYWQNPRAGVAMTLTIF